MSNATQLSSISRAIRARNIRRGKLRLEHSRREGSRRSVIDSATDEDTHVEPCLARRCRRRRRHVSPVPRISGLSTITEKCAVDDFGDGTSRHIKEKSSRGRSERLALARITRAPNTTCIRYSTLETRRTSNREDIGSTENRDRGGEQGHVRLVKRGGRRTFNEGPSCVLVGWELTFGEREDSRRRQMASPSRETSMCRQWWEPRGGVRSRSNATRRSYRGIERRPLGGG